MFVLLEVNRRFTTNNNVVIISIDLLKETCYIESASLDGNFGNSYEYINLKSDAKYLIGQYARKFYKFYELNIKTFNRIEYFIAGSARIGGKFGNDFFPNSKRSTLD